MMDFATWEPKAYKRVLYLEKFEQHGAVSVFISTPHLELKALESFWTMTNVA